MGKGIYNNGRIARFLLRDIRIRRYKEIGIEGRSSKYLKIKNLKKLKMGEEVRVLVKLRCVGIWRKRKILVKKNIRDVYSVELVRIV